MLITAPKTLVATTLTLVKCNRMSSSVSAISPAGREYIMADRLPAKILPITVLMISVAIPYFQPSKIAERRMNALEIPSLAPGKMIGGKRFSSIKDIRAAAERIPHNEILKEVFIFTP